ncbi:hypothetical protein ACT7DA_09475 [Bacillus pacificus]
MQQVALKSYYCKFKEKEGFIFSVNGPPGTGETHYSRCIANIIFEKVKFLKETQKSYLQKYNFLRQEDYYSFHSKLKEYNILMHPNNIFC